MEGQKKTGTPPRKIRLHMPKCRRPINLVRFLDPLNALYETTTSIGWRRREAATLFRADPGETQNPCHGGSPSTAEGTCLTKPYRSCPWPSFVLKRPPFFWILGAVFSSSSFCSSVELSRHFFLEHPPLSPPFFACTIASPGGRVLAQSCLGHLLRPRVRHSLPGQGSRSHSD